MPHPACGRGGRRGAPAGTVSVLLRLLALASMAATTGCAPLGAEDAAGSGPPQPRFCRTLEGCPDSLVCDLSLQLCVPRAAGVIDLEVRPPTNDRGWVAQEFLGVLPGATAELELSLDAAVFWRGHVFASDAPSTPLPADITVWRKSRIAGRPVLKLEASTVDTTPLGAPDAAASADTTAAGVFLLPLNRGQSYASVAVPRTPFDRSEPCLGSAESGCPPSYPPGYEAALSLTDHLQRDLFLDGRDRFSVLTGRVLDASGTPLPFSVDVRATGEGQAARLRSTIGRTCSKTQPSRCRCTPIERCLGEFALALPRGIERYSLHLVADASANQASGEAVIPTVECSAALLGLVALDSAGTPQPLALPSPLILPPFPAALPYELLVVGDDGSPVASAEVSLASEDFAPLQAPAELGRCRAHHRQAAVTDAEGRVTLLLLPGDNADRPYDLTIIAPARSRWASMRQARLPIAPAGGSLGPFRLAPRLLLAGRVRGPGGEPVGGVLIDATPTPAAASTAPSDTAQGSASALSGADGAFTLWVDPGVYDLALRPPSTVNFTATTLLDVDLTGPREALDLRLPAAALLEGRVVDATGVGASGCTVQAFETLVREQTGTQLPLALPRATALTDADGRFSLRLASPLP